MALERAFRFVQDPEMQTDDEEQLQSLSELIVEYSSLYVLTKGQESPLIVPSKQGNNFVAFTTPDLACAALLHLQQKAAEEPDSELWSHISCFDDVGAMVDDGDGQ